MTYEPKTSGLRRFRHAVGAANRRKNMMEANGKKFSEEVSMSMKTAQECIVDVDALVIHRQWLEDSGNRLYNALKLMPEHMLTRDMLHDLKRWDKKHDYLPDLTFP